MSHEPLRQFKNKLRLSLFLIHAGDKINEKELEEISSDPSSYYFMLVPDFQSLTERLRYQLVDHVCNPLPPPVPSKTHYL